MKTICSFHFELSQKLKQLNIIFPEPTARSTVPGVRPGRGLLIPHGYLHQSKSSSIIADAWLWFMGGPPTDLKNMANRQEWKRQRFKKICVRKITQHEEKFFVASQASHYPILKRGER